MEFRFVVESMVHGYHEHKTVWDSPVLGEELICAREIRNSYDPMAVAVKKEIHGETITVGHILKRISALCSICIKEVVIDILQGTKALDCCNHHQL